LALSGIPIYFSTLDVVWGIFDGFQCLLGLFDENGRFTAAMLSSISPKIKIF
jgi:hypothetical protein